MEDINSPTVFLQSPDAFTWIKVSAFKCQIEVSNEIFANGMECLL